MENIFWTGYSNDERHSSMSIIKNVVAKHGDIVDFKLFSDISLTMTIEIEESKIDKLYNELKKNIGIDKFECLNSISKMERIVYLNVTFVKGTGNLITEVPSVPG
jgi:phage-related tail protein